MIVTECELDLESYGGTMNATFKDDISEVYNVKLNTASRDIPLILSECALVNPLEFPLRGGAWKVRPAYGLFAHTFKFDRDAKVRTRYKIGVEYGPVPPGQPNVDGSGDNPLQYPATYSLDYLEYEEAIAEARNVEPIGAESEGGVRAALTLGEVVNGALQEFDEGIYDTQRDAVLNIFKNVSTLDEIVAFNVNYGRTTNSNNFFGAGPRRAKFLGAESGSIQIANGYSFYGMVIRVQIKKTTDVAINNTGWHWWWNDKGTKRLTKFKVLDQDTQEMEDASEPGFLRRDGASSQGVPTTLHYRYLEEVSYTGLML